MRTEKDYGKVKIFQTHCFKSLSWLYFLHSSSMLLVIKINQARSFHWNCSEKEHVCKSLNNALSLGALLKVFRRLKEELQSSYFGCANQDELSTWLSPSTGFICVFVLTTILFCWNHQFQTSSFNVVSPLDDERWNKRLMKQTTQIHKMPQQNIWPLFPLPIHPHSKWNVQLSLTTGH